MILAPYAYKNIFSNNLQNLQKRNEIASNLSTQSLNSHCTQQADQQASSSSNTVANYLPNKNIITLICNIKNAFHDTTIVIPNDRGFSPPPLPLVERNASP